MGVMTRRGVPRDTATAGPLPSDEEVAKVAYALFERRGRVHGHDWEDWFTAEQIVRGQLQRQRRR